MRATWWLWFVLQQLLQNILIFFYFGKGFFFQNISFCLFLCIWAFCKHITKHNVNLYNNRANKQLRSISIDISYSNHIPILLKVTDNYLILCIFTNYFLSNTAVCNPSCQNGGICEGPNKCQCPSHLDDRGRCVSGIFFVEINYL